MESAKRVARVRFCEENEKERREKQREKTKKKERERRGETRKIQKNFGTLPLFSFSSFLDFCSLFLHFVGERERERKPAAYFFINNNNAGVHNFSV